MLWVGGARVKLALAMRALSVLKMILSTSSLDSALERSEGGSEGGPDGGVDGGVGDGLAGGVCSNL